MSSRKSKEQWRALCAGYTRSGLTVAAFASGVGVSPRTLNWWLGQFGLRRGGMGSGERLRDSRRKTARSLCDPVQRARPPETQ
jgi:hypothetical protein